MTTIDGKRTATATASTRDSSSTSSSSSSSRARPYKKLRLAGGSGPPPSRGWLETMARMGGSPPAILISKTLTLSDTKAEQNRLLLARSDMESSELGGILTSAEEEEMNDKEKGLAVRVLDGEGREYHMTLKFLDSNNGYRLIGHDWRRFVANNRLKPGIDAVDLWAFRAPRGGAAARYHQEHDDADELWLAITALRTDSFITMPAAVEMRTRDPSSLRGLKRNWKVKL